MRWYLHCLGRQRLQALAANLRNGRVVVKMLGSLRRVLTQRFHVPKPGVQAIVSSLLSQKVLTAQKNGSIAALDQVST